MKAEIIQRGNNAALSIDGNEVYQEFNESPEMIDMCEKCIKYYEDYIKDVDKELKRIKLRIAVSEAIIKDASSIISHRTNKTNTEHDK